MIDQMDKTVARQLAERHLYPYSQNIYQSIFKYFSHFPVDLQDINIKGQGVSITVMAWSILSALQMRFRPFEILNTEIYAHIRSNIPAYFPQDPIIDVFFGSILFQYHPAQVKNALSLINAENRFDSRQLYEYELKKRTLFIYIV